MQKKTKPYPASWPKYVIKYLRDRGINYQLAKKAGIRPGEVILSAKSRLKTLQIPYFSPDGKKLIDKGTNEPYITHRIFHKESVLSTKEKRRYPEKRKFHSPPGSHNHPYFPKTVNNLEAKLRDPEIPIAITEGPIKSLCASTYEIFDWIVIALSGVDNFVTRINGKNNPSVFLPEFQEIDWVNRVVWILYDADIIENPLVLQARTRLTHQLCINGASVYATEWPIEWGKGLDDILVAGYLDDFCKLEDIPLDDGGQILKLAERYILIAYLNQFWDKYSNKLVDPRGIDNLHRRKIKAPSKTFLESPLTHIVEDITYKPGSEQIIYKGKIRQWNTWIRPNTPVTEGSADTFLNHVEYIFDNEDVSINYFLDWLAFIVQFPGEKIMSAILLQGNQGIGKSYFSYVFSGLVGKENIVMIENEHLKSDFNEWVLGAQIVVVEEIRSLDIRQISNKLKSLITQPDLLVNKKYAPIFEIENCMNFLLLTNYENSLLIDRDDRRYFVHYSKAIKKNATYYNKLWKWTDKNIGCILNYLLNRDLSNFNHHAAPPKTQSKLDAIDRSTSDMVSYLLECFNNNTAPLMHELILLEDITDHLRDKFSNKPYRNETLNVLRHIGAINLGQKRIDKKSKRTVWAIRNTKQWRHCSESKISEYFKSIRGGKAFFQ